MNAYKRYKNRLEQFLQTENGKRAIHFAYSFGAAVVILGAMFKLLYLPYGNEMLFIGMVTEVIVFILSAFDTPVRDYPWEQVFPVLGNEKNITESNVEAAAAGLLHIPSGTHPGSSNTPNRTAEYGNNADNLSNKSKLSDACDQQLESLSRTLAGLNSLYELQLKGVSNQINSIEQINKDLTRLGSIYSGTLPEGITIKRETERMAAQLVELNNAYSRMLDAMTSIRNNPNSRDPQ
jgi:hypothetical protein